MNGPNASSANPIVIASQRLRGRYRAYHIARTMIASDTRLSDAVYSTKIVGLSASGSSNSHRAIGCCGFGVTNDSRSTPRGLLRQKISGLTNRPSATRFGKSIENGRERSDARQGRDQDRPDRQRPEIGQLEMRAPPDHRARDHQHRQDQHRRVEASRVDRHAEQREFAAAAEHQSGDQSAEAHDQDVERPGPGPRCGRRPPRHPQPRRADIQRADHQAIDAEVGIRQRRPRHAHADERCIARRT